MSNAESYLAVKTASNRVWVTDRGRAAFEAEWEHALAHNELLPLEVVEDDPLTLNPHQIESVQVVRAGDKHYEDARGRERRAERDRADIASLATAAPAPGKVIDVNR